MSQTLEVYTALWALQAEVADGRASYQDLVTRTAQAGYAGLALDFGATPAQDIARIHPMMARAGLTPVLVDFPKTIESLRPTLQLARDIGAPFVIVIGQVMPQRVDDMAEVIRAWCEMSDTEGVQIQFETHRNCITNDLLTTLCLLEDVPQMRLCADLSHYVVGREMSHPIPPETFEQISRILVRSDSFQGRVAGRQQIQLPLHFAQSQKWVTLFRDWWREGFALWRARNPDGVCRFVCELGPPDYALTDQQGAEFSDRWEEALILKSWAETAWAETAPTPPDPNRQGDQSVLRDR